MNSFLSFLFNKKKVKLEEIRNYLFNHLVSNSFNFHKVNRKDEMRRNTEYGKDIFHLMIHKRSYGYAVEAGAYKRFDQLEKIYANYKRDKEYQKNTVTIGGRLGPILGRRLPKGYNVVPNYEYDIVTMHDLQKVTRKLIKLYNQTEKLFFEKFNTYKELYDIVNVDLQHCGKYDGIYFDKALLGLTLSKLLEDEKYELIKATYTESVELYVPHKLSKFKDFINTLEKNN